MYELSASVSPDLSGHFSLDLYTFFITNAVELTDTWNDLQSCRYAAIHVRGAHAAQG